MSQEFYTQEQPNIDATQSFVDAQMKLQADSDANSAKTLGTVSIVFAFISPLISWICGGIGSGKAKKALAAVPGHPVATKAKKNCKTGIILSIVIWLVAVIAMFAMGFGAAETADDDYTPIDDSSYQSDVSATRDESNPNAIGDYECSVVSAEICKDYQGKDALKVTYNFVNNSTDAISFDLALTALAYQNGIGLETAILLDDDDVDYGIDVNIKPGVSKEVIKVYSLQDTTTPVEVEITEWISFTDETLTTVIELV